MGLLAFLAIFGWTCAIFSVRQLKKYPNDAMLKSAWIVSTALSAVSLVCIILMVFNK